MQESGRGTVSGTFAITDPGAPNASPAGMWIGLAPDVGDFQQQFFTYEFWVQTGPAAPLPFRMWFPELMTFMHSGRVSPGHSRKPGSRSRQDKILTLER